MFCIVSILICFVVAPNITKDYTTSFAIEYEEVKKQFKKKKLLRINFCIDAVPQLLYPANETCSINISCTTVAPGIIGNYSNISTVIDYELEAEQSCLDTATAELGSKDGTQMSIHGLAVNVTKTRLVPWCDKIAEIVLAMEPIPDKMPPCTKRNSSAAIEVEILPNYASPKLEFSLTPEAQYRLSHHADPNEFVEEFRLESLPREIMLEQKALRTLYHSANGIHWRQNWDFTNATLCGQYGVVCSTERHVLELNLTANNLTGTVPPIFRHLQQLLLLDLSVNFLFGGIDWTATLPLLNKLRLSHNRFTGTIHPDLFKDNPSLTTFEIESNYIHGAIPITFGLHRNMNVFRISNNRITGSLPPFLCDHIALKVIMASHNRLSGPFPLGFADCDDLEVLILSHNRLSGALPSSLNASRELKILALDHNELEGEVADLRALRRLQIVWLHNNRLSGKVPSFVNKANNTKVQELRCGGNYFECQPQTICTETSPSFTMIRPPTLRTALKSCALCTSMRRRASASLWRTIFVCMSV